MKVFQAFDVINQTKTAEIRNLLKDLHVEWLRLSNYAGMY